MAKGLQRHEHQGTLRKPADRLGGGQENPFYGRVNQLLAEIDFDKKLEEAAESYHESTGRRGLAPAVYFRMLFARYFEDISSQRGTAWRCEGSRSLARFLGDGPGEAIPAHDTLTLTRKRLPMSIHSLAFCLILEVAGEKGKTAGVDAPKLKANASLVSERQRR